MSIHIQKSGQRLLGAAVVILLGYLFLFGPFSSLIPGRGPAVSIVPRAAQVTNIANVKNDVPELPLPGTDVTTLAQQNINYELMAWNAQFPLMLANGGASTTTGSLIEKYAAVNINLLRQDDCNQMQNDLIAFAQAVHDGNPYPTDKPAFVAIMADGGAQFLQGINPLLEKKFGPDYVAQIVMSTGYSWGEDKLMGPEAWKTNPKSMRGCVIAGVLRDGDWNICMKFAADNGILNNPDETVYDPNAINWVAAKDFLDAPQKLIAGYSEDRPVVVNGKKTGETRHIKVGGCVTWTPGDVNVAEQIGGIVAIVSTKKYSGQMPQATVGIKRWCQDNRNIVEGLIQAIGEAGDQIKQYPNAIRRAGEISQEVYKETDRDGAYWVKYYQGDDHAQDKQGNEVSLGGSKANNLADMALLFGPTGLLKSTYVTFGNIVVQQYPKLVPAFPKPEEVIDGSYVMDVVKKTNTSLAVADHYKFDKSTTLHEVVGKRKYQIQFATGSAKIANGQETVLENLKDELAVASALKVVIHGHTDNTGTAQGNITLSQARANAVKNWLEVTYPEVFPEGRVNAIGHGQNTPVADNSTEDGRAKNRRVEIVTGN